MPSLHTSRALGVGAPGSSAAPWQRRKRQRPRTRGGPMPSISPCPASGESSSCCPYSNLIYFPFAGRSNHRSQQPYSLVSRRRARNTLLPLREQHRIRLGSVGGFRRNAPNRNPMTYRDSYGVTTGLRLNLDAFALRHLENPQ